MRVRFAPELKSDLFPSRMMIGPRAVQAGEIALAALSARMLVAPVAGVTVTTAYAQVARRNMYIAANRTAARAPEDFALRRKCRSASRRTEPKPIFLAEKACTDWI